MSENKVEIELPEKELKQIKEFCLITNIELNLFLERSILNEFATLKDEIEKCEPTILEDYFSENIFNKLKSIFS
jgi:hypothetical protein